MGLPPIFKFVKKLAVAGGHAKVASSALERKAGVALIEVGERQPWSALKRAAAPRAAAPQYASAIERSFDPVSMHPPAIGHQLALLERSLPKSSGSVRSMQQTFHKVLLPAVERYFETGAGDFSQPFSLMSRELRLLETELIDQLRKVKKTESDLSGFEAASGHIDALHQVLGKLAGKHSEVAAAALGKRLSDAVLSRQLETGAGYIAAHAEHFRFDASGLQMSVKALSTASARSMAARYDDLLNSLDGLEHGLIKNARLEHLSNDEKDALYDVASAFGSIQEGALRLFREADLKAPTTMAGTKLRGALKAAAT